MNGKNLGHYRVGEQLGRGGMGEVYSAEDLNLNRKVALKFLPDAFAGDPERMARFEREAKLLASLNHPNIAAIYGLEQAEGKRFLVLELVEGETLAQRLSKGALPIEEALGICKQIAEGLGAAHEKGVIHRDLKPANVMITEGDKVKILDFGLAKALSGETQPVEASQSPTLTEAMTRPGIILGTAAYMSPEQAKGKAVDKRADIWAFGCILYECLTGKKAFEGETVTETLAAILKGDPDWEALPVTTPPNIRFALRRCLEREVGRRFRDVGDALIGIDEMATTPRPQGPVAGRTIWKPAALSLLGLIILASIGLFALWRLHTTVPLKIIRFSCLLPEDQRFLATAWRLLAISPDGTTFVYEANGQLYLKRMSEAESRVVPGTEQFINNPFFSPDNQWIGFYSRMDGALKKIPVSGGAAVTICKASNPSGVSWQGETIVFGQGSRGIFSVPAGGGKPENWIKMEPGEYADTPQILADGEVVLFAALRLTSPGLRVTSLWDKAKIIAYSRKSGKRKVLVQGGSSPRYVPTGHLIYALGTNLLMVPMDLGRLEITGGSVPILEGIARATGTTAAAANFDVSEDGTLLYIPGNRNPLITERRVLALVDRNGNRDVLGLPPGFYDFPRLSPDGKQLAVVTDDEGATVYIHDMSGKTALRRLTFEGANSFPVWSPDGRQIAFYSDRDSKPGIFLQPADGSKPAQRLANLPPADVYIPSSWSPDGKTIAFAAGKGGDYGIWTITLAGERKSELFMDVAGSAQVHPTFSADGNWVAYMSNESGGHGISYFNIYAQPFPKTGAAKYQISNSGVNDFPAWSPVGKELIYYSLSSEKLMAVPVQTKPTFNFGQPMPLPIEGILQATGGRRYDIMPDGNRFLVMLPEIQTKESLRRLQQVNVVLNWFEELKSK